MTETNVVIQPRLAGLTPKLDRMVYRHPEHETFPHIVHFSGGRSSGYMTLGLAESGALNPDRGDVVFFCNTSAEHSGTYDFVAKIKRTLEYEHNIPCFWVEKRWDGKGTYRLVKPVPVETDSEGYRWKGEIYRRMCEKTKYLPSAMVRICTNHLKILPSYNTTKDWVNSNISGWGKFSDATLVERPRSKQSLRGKDHVRFVKLLGLRADEPNRVEKVMLRSLDSEGCLSGSNPPGEYMYTPLYDSSVNVEDINLWWKQRPYDLGVPAGAGNCVYCFLKGTKNLAKLPSKIGTDFVENTPSDKQWWIDTENEYARDVKKPGQYRNQKYKFLGLNRISYEQLFSGVKPKVAVDESFCMTCVD